MDQSRSMASILTSASRRTGSTSGTPKIMVPAGMSPASGTSCPTLATVRRHWLPRYDKSPEQVSAVVWNGGMPSTRTASWSTIVLPPST